MHWCQDVDAKNDTVYKYTMAMAAAAALLRIFAVGLVQIYRAWPLKFLSFLSFLSF